MREAILIIVFLIVRSTVFAQSSGENYIRIRQMTNESGSEYIESVRYYDGLGRHIQTVQCGVTPQGNDLVDYTCYDGAGRPITQFLPSVSNQNGSFVSLPQVKTFSENTYGDSYAYTTIQYEQSDLGRVTNQFRPGSAWQSTAHSRKNFYDLNDSSVPALNCIRYTVAESYTLTDTVMSVKNSGNFPTGSLYVLKSQDEDDHTVYTFTDSSDKTHLVRRVLDNNTFADTYYVYDLFDNLCAVLSPEASAKMKTSETTWNSSSPELSELSFLYIYDYLRHCIAKKLPGAAWVLMVNDIGGRLVYSQDGVQRSRGEWLFILYDDLNRPCVNGISYNSFDIFNDSTILFVNHLRRNNTKNDFLGYEIYLNEFAQADGLKNCVPVNPIVLSVNYYDDYSFMGHFGFPEESSPLMVYEAHDDYGTRYEASARTFLTGTVTALLDREYFSHSGGTVDNSTPKYLHSVMYYNDHEECIQKIESNHLGGYDRYYSQYGFTGNLLKQRVVHTRKNPSHSAGQSPDIDFAGYETISDDVYEYYYD
ncbi:MAG: hypothetical protein K2J74_06385, partial [Muribaculaceae bacterium]|nr:hypothetical protein [Muribaculaceae bacterium]